MNLDRLASFGPNAGYLIELYQLYLSDPSLVDPAWASFFAGLDAGNGSSQPATVVPTAAVPATVNGNGHAAAYPASANGASKAAAATVDYGRIADRLVDSYRRFGHVAARTNPLLSGSLMPYRPVELSLDYNGGAADPAKLSLSGYTFGGRSVSSCAELLTALEQTFCGSVGFEYMHLTNAEERAWLAERIEGGFIGESASSAERKRIIEKLVAGELFESELHRKYVGTKRFSLEGTETLIAVLDAALDAASQGGVREVIFGMAHRGRLNVLANTLGKPLDVIFSEFEDLSMATVVGAGDVKYHLGYEGTYTGTTGETLRLEMAPNPSHLEFVNPVAEGVARALQDNRYGRDRKSVLPLLMHGDAAFAGQGVVFETINFSLVPGYATGGTLHVVINNQIGFTTTPDESRSTFYCTDLAKGIDSPVFHVNSEDPEAACWVARLATEFRNRFGKDVFIDLIGYRKHGHNEGDDPSFTQPTIYAEIKGKNPLWKTYAARVGEAEAAESMAQLYKDFFAAAQAPNTRPVIGEACAMHGRLRIPTPETGVAGETLKLIARSLVKFPNGFVPHPKLAKIVEKRVETVEQGEGIEWGVAEGLAFGSLVLEGRSIRLSGQDCGRGTFSQRHLLLDNYEGGEVFSPLASLAAESGSEGRFEVYNSPLSEAGIVGFEFGYSATDSRSLVIWEAQFGDFSNGAQVMIDQFIASSEAKWAQLSGVTLMLPHGYEGQGPEHSSARLERYLQLCGEGNMCVCYPSTAAQHFHLLRRQALLEIKRPLVIMTPKSLLRLPSAMSTRAELEQGSFKPIIEDDLSGGGKVQRAILLSGKVYHDVAAALRPLGKLPVKIIRVEQLHPFPQFEFKKALKDVKSTSVLWVQEEPENMGAWSYVQPYLERKLGLEATYVGRPTSATTATGSPKHHAREQKAIVEEVIKFATGK